MKKYRFLASLLCLSMISTQFNIVNAQNSEITTSEESDHDHDHLTDHSPKEKEERKNDSYQIWLLNEDQSEEPVAGKSVSLPYDEKKVLTTNVTGNIQWQIKVPGVDWVNISGANEASLSISRPLVENLLDSDRIASIRVAEVNESEIIFSNSVNVVLLEAEPAEETEPNLSVHDPVIVEEAKVTDTTPEQQDNSENVEGDNAPSPVEPTEEVGDQGNSEIDNSELIENIAEESISEEQVAPTEPQSETSSEDIILPYRNNRIFRLNDEEPAPVEKVDFVIRYVFKDGKEAATAKSLTVNKGDSLYHRVDSPIILGFEADQPFVEFSIPEVTKGEVLTVTYNPSNVGFKVQLYQQHLNDDGYDLVSEDSLPGYTGTKVENEISKNNYSNLFEGFSLLNYENADIAADGSTTIRLYYDRNYYLMMFDLDGGWGDNVEPIYARYGSKISVGIPLKTGYSFSYWSTDGIQSSVPTTMPSVNTTFKANWMPEEKATVKYVFYGQDPDIVSNDGTLISNSDYSYLKTAYKTLPVGTTASFEMDYEFDTGIICGEEIHIHTDLCKREIEHTHSLTCYSDVASWSWNEGEIPSPDGKAEGEIALIKYKRLENWQINDVQGLAININGEYKKYNGKLAEGQIANPICSPKFELICGKEEHEHSKSCYGNFNVSSEFPSHLWTLKGIDESTVNADGSSIVNVYLDRTVFTIFFYNTDGNNPINSIQAKWGSQIRNRFLRISAINGVDGSQSWSESKSGSAPWTACMDLMPARNVQFYKQKNGSGKNTGYYYLQSINDNSYDSGFSITASFSTITQEDIFEIDGFTLNESKSHKVGQYFNNSKFYYDRNVYHIVFSNLNNDITKDYKFEQNISNAFFSPDESQIPDNYEPGSVEFAGWYQNERGVGEPYVFENKTMPSKHILLYAKWIPKTYNVTFKINENDGEYCFDSQTVSHGSKITEVGIPQNGSYIFDNWFYRDENGVEHPFHPDMPVKQDLNLYAKWNSNIRVDFTLKYYYIDKESGEKIYIADDKQVNGLNGTEDTFYAKTGSELYNSYRDGYFPKTSSHTINFNANSTAEENIYEFEYEKAQDVGYTIHYYKKGTSESVYPSYNGKTSKILETFDAVYIKDMRAIPQSQQKVMSTDPNENIIIFEYEVDTENSPYRIIHMIQNAEGDDYSQYSDPTEGWEVRNSPIEINPLTIKGFDFDHATSQIEKSSPDAADEPINPINFNSDLKGTITLTNDGRRTTIILYYNRKPVKYTVRYRLESSNDSDPDLVDPDSGTGRFDTVLNFTAKAISGYLPVKTSTSVRLNNVEDGHEIIFYYKEDKANIKYIAVGPEDEDFGSVDPTAESVDIFSGRAEGSTATAKKGFKFAGWFTDKECTQPAGDESDKSIEPHFTPEKDKEYSRTFNKKEIKVMGYRSATYYAKFVRDTGKLKINKTVNGGDSSEKIFYFRVTNADNNFDLSVSVNSKNGSVTIDDLPVSDAPYVIEELMGWNGFDYKTVSETSQSVSVKAETNDKPAEVSFTNEKASDNNWFKDSDSKANVFNQRKVGA